MDVTATSESTQHPHRRVTLGLSRGGSMSVSLPGRADTPVEQATLEALRSIGEAALDKMLEEDEPE